MLPGLHIVKRLVGLVLLLCLSGNTAHVPAQAGKIVAKPRSPVSITLEPVAAFVAGKPVDFEVRVLSAVAAWSVTVEIVLPESSIVHQGRLNWQGSLAQDQQKILAFQATIPALSPEPLSATVIIGEPDSVRFSDRALFQTPNSLAATAAAVSRAGTRTIMHNGVQIEEHTLR